MSETDTSRVLAALRDRERELQAEMNTIHARLDEVRLLMAELEGRKRGRPRKSDKSDIIEMPMRVGGSASSPDPEAA